MKILHSYLDHPDYAERNRETWDFYQQNEAVLSALGFEVEHLRIPPNVPGRADNDAYNRALARVWAAGEPFINNEQDIVTTVAMLQELDQCERPWCAQDYPLYARNCVRHVYIATPGGGPKLVCVEHNSGYESFRVRDDESSEGWRWGRTGETEANLTALGLTRFRVDQLPKGTDWSIGWWATLDDRLARYLHAKGVTAHIHYPVAKHNHPGQEPFAHGMFKVGDTPMVIAVKEELNAEELVEYERGMAVFLPKK